MWSACGSGWLVTRCTPTPHCPLPPGEASSDQEWYYCGSVWHLVSLWVRLTCSQMYPLCPPPFTQSPPCPLLPVEASSGQELYYCGSAWHVISLWVRLTCSQMYPLPHHPHNLHPFLPPCTHPNPSPYVETSCGQVWYYFGSMTFGQMYPHMPHPACPILSPHSPPLCKDISWPSLVLLWAG